VGKIHCDDLHSPAKDARAADVSRQRGLLSQWLHRVVGCRFLRSADQWAFQEVFIMLANFQARVISQQAFDISTFTAFVMANSTLLGARRQPRRAAPLEGLVVFQAVHTLTRGVEPFLRAFAAGRPDVVGLMWVIVELDSTCHSFPS
jgi:hypothetical protein